MKNKIPKVTILTDPIIWGKDFFEESFRRLIRSIFNEINILINRTIDRNMYRGHFAVTRSLIEGLKKSNLDFNYNPKSIQNLADTVIVLAGIRTLKQAIELKKEGKIKKLFAGPNIVSFATDYDSIITNSLVDCYILNSDWTEKLYIGDSPSLTGRTFQWPAGVDTNFWKPNELKEQNQILIFDKRLSDDDSERIVPFVKYLEDSNWKVKVLSRVGEKGYTREEFLDLLQSSCLVIGFTVGSESQGIAWVEAWSCDVPTLILKNSTSMIQGRKIEVSTAPYLSNENGLFFDNFEDFKIKFEYWKNHRQDFQARKWTLENMSDEVCASLLYKKITSNGESINYSKER